MSRERCPVRFHRGLGAPTRSLASPHEVSSLPADTSSAFTLIMLAGASAPALAQYGPGSSWNHGRGLSFGSVQQSSVDNPANDEAGNSV